MTLIPVDEVYQSERFSALKKGGYLIDINALGEYEKSVHGNRSAEPSQNYWKGKRVLITGASGMVGSTMIDLLLGMGAEVYGTIKRHAVAYHPHLAHHMDGGRLKTLEVDLRDYGRVSSLVRKIDPHVISHQAAESFVPSSLEQPSHVVENNCVSTVNVLEAAAKEGKSVEGVQLACSSEQYGFVKNVEEIPVREESELRPTSTYAATKVFTEFIGKSYYYTYSTPTVMTRTFNQEGPRRGPQFFTARVAMQVRKILDGKADKLVMGNPNSVRDFTHVHDSTRAQLLAIEKCDRGKTYNICSGKGITTGDHARLAMNVFGLQSPIMVDKSLLRPYEKGDALFDGFIGSSAKFSEKTGWKPTKAVTDIIRDQVAYYKS